MEGDNSATCVLCVCLPSNVSGSLKDLSLDLNELEIQLGTRMRPSRTRKNNRRVSGAVRQVPPSTSYSSQLCHVFYVFSKQIQVTSADLSSHLSESPESEEQLQVQVSPFGRVRSSRCDTLCLNCLSRIRSFESIDNNNSPVQQQHSPITTLLLLAVCKETNKKAVLWLTG